VSARVVDGREETRTELICAVCGYGISVRSAPELCPMCGSSVWEHPPRRLPPLVADLWPTPPTQQHAAEGM